MSTSTEAQLANLTALLETMTDKYNQIEKILESRLNVTQQAEYKDVIYTNSVVNTCKVSLEPIKSLASFSGEDLGIYSSWRQIATTIFSAFKGQEKSSTYFDATIIFRSKIIGKADSLLSSYGTKTHFDAIMARLDFAYANKTPIYILEQQLQTLVQGSNDLISFYGEIEKKLTLLVNKNIMSFGDSATAQAYNEKCREMALRTFINGVNPHLQRVLFAMQLPDLPTALVKAQELEANEQFTHLMHLNNSRQQNIKYREDRPNYRLPSLPKPQHQYNNNRPFPNDNTRQIARPEPMDVDQSFRQIRQNSQTHNRGFDKPFKYNQNNNSNNNKSFYPNNPQYRNNYDNKPQWENRQQQAFKRPPQQSMSNQHFGKTPRLNHLGNPVEIDHDVEFMNFLG